MPHKQCTACNQTKPIIEYSPSKRGGFGVQAKCKPCYAELMKARRLDNPLAHKEAVKKSTEKHYDKKLQRNSAYRAANPDKVSAWKQKDRTINKARVSADNAMRRSKMSGKLTPEINQMYALRDFYIAMSLGNSFHVDHIAPLSKGGEHKAFNLQILPAIDNLRKGSNDTP
jgi:5-methylcytosine-specific restriction endonuclease McrA